MAASCKSSKDEGQAKTFTIIILQQLRYRSLDISLISLVRTDKTNDLKGTHCEKKTQNSLKFQHCFLQ